MFWQLTIDANNPALLARFRAQALGYQPAPPTEPKTTWHAHYRPGWARTPPSMTGSSIRRGCARRSGSRRCRRPRPGRTASIWTSTQPAATMRCRWSGGSRSWRRRSPNWPGWAPAWIDGPGTRTRRTRSTTSSCATRRQRVLRRSGPGYTQTRPGGSHSVRVHRTATQMATRCVHIRLICTWLSIFRHLPTESHHVRSVTVCLQCLTRGRWTWSANTPRSPPNSSVAPPGSSCPPSWPSPSLRPT